MSIFSISVVIPLYNEENIFPQLIERLLPVITQFPQQVQVVLVNDGSTDKTPALMQTLSERDPRFKAVFLSRNFGHQQAVSAGLQFADATEAILVMDGDLQDPPELIYAFYDKIKEGYDVVYAIRRKRKEGLLYRVLFWSYYRIQKMVSNFDIPIDSGDFCMMRKRIKDVLIAMPEENRYLRGMRAWAGFKQVGFPYDRDARFAGHSNYGFKKLTALALNGIFNFSRAPIKFMYTMGTFSILLAFAYILFLLWLKLSAHPLPQGYVTLIFAISFFSGIQLITLGLIGEYVYRIYGQVRKRPLFLIDKIIN
ncbi:MAG: glycosyltransferase [Azospira oryzae]|nr:MAG: glycosyltransferase [Azospira oryzae]